MLTTGGKLSLSKKPKSDIELVVRVADLECAESAIQAGADALYFGGDRFMHGSSSYTASEFAEFVKDGDAQNIRLAVLSPRIGDERELEEWRWYLRKLSKLRPLKLGVSNLGALQVAREMKFKEIIADFSFNVSNSVEVDELSTLGVQRVTASVELECQDLMEFAGTSRLPIEVIGHGPLPGMLLEHCVVAAASGESGQNVCSMTCHNKEFTMWDKSGQSYRLMCDRRCRNHLFTANDVCVLPNLVHILTGAVSALRIEAQFEDAETTACIVSVYRKAIDTLSNLEPFDFTDSLQQLESVAKRPFSDGAFAFDRL
jgi:putative protease